MKLFRILPILLAIALCNVACTDDSDDSSSTSSNTKITYFCVSNDSIENCILYAFTIDNDSNVIYNVDSLPYGSDVSHLVPVMYGTTLQSILINDSITYSSSDGDSIDFTHPVTLKTTATDGESTRAYLVRVNVHQVNPDDYHWQQVQTESLSATDILQQKTLLFDSKLYFFAKTSSSILLATSTNGVDWTEQTLSGLPSSTDLNGILATDSSLIVVAENALYSAENGVTWAKQYDLTNVSRLLFALNGAYYAIGENAGVQVMLNSTDLQTWSQVMNLPTDFPVSDCAVCVEASVTGRMRAFLIGGVSASGETLATVWSSDNGTYWINLTAQRTGFAARSGSAVVQYDKHLLLVGGQLADGSVTSEMLQSPDYGLTWREVSDSCSVLPDEFVARANHSLVKTSENYLYIVGGQTASGVVTDVWCGRKNAAIPGFLNNVP